LLKGAAMKRMFILFAVLVVALSAALALRLRAQALAAARPSGGSATVEGTRVDVTARVSARIAELAVDEGDTVTAGQVVARLDCPEVEASGRATGARVAAARIGVESATVQLAQAKHGVKAARKQSAAAVAQARAQAAQQAALAAQRDDARRTADRLGKLRETGAVPDETFEQSSSRATGLGEQVRALGENARAASAQSEAVAETAGTAALQVRAAELRVAGAERELEAALAQQAQVDALLAECTLKAPRDAIVQTRHFEVGEAVMPGTRLFTLVDLREVRATFYLPNAELAAARPGQAVEVHPDALPERTFPGTVRRVSPQAEFTPRNAQTRSDRDRLVYAVEVSIPNADGALRPGMPVDIAVR
jgi:HlyD family secretion protein